VASDKFAFRSRENLGKGEVIASYRQEEAKESSPKNGMELLGSWAFVIGVGRQARDGGGIRRRLPV
jgi:hypothetical protein